MPVALAGFFSGVGLLVAGTIGLTVGPIAALAIGVTTVVGAAVTFRRASSIKDLSDVRRQQSLGIVVRSTETPRNLVFGEQIVGGPLSYSNVGGDEARELYYEVIHTGHQINAFIGWRFDDRTIYLADIDDINASPAGDGSVDADTNSHGLGPIDSTPTAYLRGHLGAADQTVDSMLESAFPADIGGSPSTHRHRGRARTIARFDLLRGAEEVWDGRAPSAPAAIVQGRLMYDPRQDGTLGYSPDGGHRVGTPSTWAYSNNPALCLADYLIDSTHGPGIASSRIDYASFAAAADICDTLVDIPPVASPQTQEKRFVCNLVADTSMNHADIIQQILDTMGGRLVYYNGQYGIFASAWESTSFSLSDSDLVSDYIWQKQPSTQRGDRYNQVRGTYIDPNRNWKVSQFITVDDTTLRTNRDNSKVLPVEMTLHGVTSEYQAQRLAYRLINQADNTGVLEFPTGYQGADIRVGDTGTVTLSELGFSAKTFRCVGVQYNDFQGVTLTLKEDASGDYADPAVGDYGTRDESGGITYARIRRNLDASQNLMSDPFMERSTKLWTGASADPGNHLAYFWNIANTQANGSVSIARTGGQSGSGIMSLTSTSGVSNNARAHSIPRQAQLGIAGEYVIVTVRLRRTTASLSAPSPDATCIILQAGLGDEDGIGNFGNEAAYTIDHATVGGWTQNQWQQVSFLQQLGLLSLTSFSGPYCVGEVYVSTDTDTLTIEVDSFTIQRTADPNL